VYTIGHSNHELEAFIALLQGAGIHTLVDVRSQPYSRWAGQFNREALMRSLQRAGFTYVYLGDVLGGRPDDPSLSAESHEDAPSKHARPDYDRMAAAPAFQAGLDRLLALAEQAPDGAAVAIMCSEGDYHHCHRTLLITPQLLMRGARVLHIKPDGALDEGHIEPPPPKQLSLL
jgi:uncharacterized protein (DUF488 family)